MPNFNAKTAWQRTDQQSGIISNGELPNITGQVWSWRGKYTTDFGSIAGRNDGKSLYGIGGNRTYALPDTESIGSNAGATSLNLDASKSSSIYKNVSLVVPANISILYCIKY